MSKLGRRPQVHLVGALVAVTVSLGAAPNTADVASLSDHWILAGDQATNQLIAFDPAVSDWNNPAAVMWSWTPTQALGFSAAEVTAFGRVTDFKLRNTPSGQRIALTASNGLAAVISYPEGVKQWALVLPASHNWTAAALPDGTLHVQSLVPGSGVYDLSRSTGGAWSQSTLIDSNDAITRISSAVSPDGTLHVQTVVPGYGLWDRERSSSGSWSTASKLDATKTIFSVYGAGLPNGDVHVGHAAYVY